MRNVAKFQKNVTLQQFKVIFHFILFHLFADNIAIYKADTVILGCRSPQGNILLRGAYRNKKAVLPQGNRAMPQVFFSVEVRQQHSLQV